MFSRDRSKKVELLARVFDPRSTGRFMKGFRYANAGLVDGNTFLPVAFSLLSSANETNRLNGVSASVDKRTVGYRRRAEAMQKGTDTLISLIDQAQRSGIQARYVLFDSWFAFPKTILRVLDQKLDVICMLKAMPKRVLRLRWAEAQSQGAVRQSEEAIWARRSASRGTYHHRKRRAR